MRQLHPNIDDAPFTILFIFFRSMSVPSVIVGCDVSKAKLDLAIMNVDGQVLEQFIVGNTSEGVAEILRKLLPFGQVKLILEATSFYHYRLAFTARETGHDVRVVNPYLMKQFIKVGLRKTKTDKMDARRLAQIGRTDVFIPPFTETLNDIRAKTLSKSVVQFRKFKRIASQRLHQLEEMDVFVGGLGGIVETFENMANTFKQTIDEAGELLRACTPEDTKLIATIPGVSETTAAEVCASLGDVTRFKTRDAIAAFAGLDPSQSTSGSSVRGKSRITKHGSTLLRGALSRAAWGAMMHNPRFRAYWEKKKKEGKHYYEIMVAVARKILQLIYSMLISRKPYDPLRCPQTGT